MELEQYRQIKQGGPRSYIFPRPCFSLVDSSRVCGEAGKLHYVDSDTNKSISVSPLVAYEFRYLREPVHAAETGLSTWGNSGPLSFYLDARMFSEFHRQAYPESYDREFVERQSKEESHGAAYVSFSRFRHNLSYDWAWGRLTVARDAVHWGPGLYGNLVFNQQAVPFDQAVFSTRIGPLSVISLYGRLTVSEPGEFPSDTTQRSVYAHRYEFTPSPRWVFGVSEQLILFDREAPFAFAPIVPLYIAKAYAGESHNNGNIAGDVSYVFPGLGHLYSEFLIDDLKSPSGLFDNLWANKWAWLAGAHFIGDWGNSRGGVVLEYTRVEPWVYTHYLPKTGQAANQGVPLGNPDGPNSQRATAKFYGEEGGKWFMSLTATALWKGTDRGSSLADTINEHSMATKEFLKGVSEPELSFLPSAGMQWGAWSALAETSFGGEIRSRFRLAYRY